MSASIAAAPAEARVGAIAALVLACALIWKLTSVIQAVPASGAIQLIMLAMLSWSSRGIFRGRGGLPVVSIVMFMLALCGIGVLFMLGRGDASPLDAMTSTAGFVFTSAVILLVGWSVLGIGCLRHSNRGGGAVWQAIGVCYLFAIPALVAGLCFGIMGSAHAFSIDARLLAGTCGVIGALLLFIGLVAHAWSLVSRPPGLTP